MAADAAWLPRRTSCTSTRYPILSRTSQDKARELVGILTRVQLRSRLFLVPFGGIQQQIVVSVPPPLRVVIYRRMMLRIAEELARESGAHALVTGDAVGQVASQTIDNLAVVGRVATLPLLRPLVGMDKEEITADAQRIGTYRTSIVPDEDCCTLFTPRFPATRASREGVERAERALDVPALVQAAIDAREIVDVRFPPRADRAGAGQADRPGLDPRRLAREPGDRVGHVPTPAGAGRASPYNLQHGHSESRPSGPSRAPDAGRRPSRRRK